MAGCKDFREIAAWQLSRDVRLLVYQLAKQRDLVRDFKFRDQWLDASHSAPRNIAEGFARYKHKECAQFVRIAKGSVANRTHFI